MHSYSPFTESGFGIPLFDRVSAKKFVPIPAVVP